MAAIRKRYEVIGSWRKEITRDQWKALAAGFSGWLLDAFDAMIFPFSLTSIRDEFGLSNAEAGALASITLLTSIGGVLFGMLADRIGRVRALSYSILAYSVFTALLATSQNLWQLILWRALVGFGLGGEWAAGSALVSEAWPAKHRGKAIGMMQSGWAVGYLIAAAVSSSVLSHFGWRYLFAMGVLPAIATFFIRRNLRGVETVIVRAKPEATSSGLLRASPTQRPNPFEGFLELFSARWRRYTFLSTLLSTLVLFAYWGLFTWIPTYLSTPTAKGGAGLSLFKSSAWVIPMQVGSFFGYTIFGILK